MTRRTKRTTVAGMKRILTSAWTTMSPRVRMDFEPATGGSARMRMPQLPTNSMRLRDLADGGTPEPRSSPDLLVRVINIAHECGTSDSNSSMPGMFK